MSSLEPLVSIIIPTHNRALVIGATLDSISAQSYTHWECIVVDDGSTDITAELVGTYMERDTRFLYLQRPKAHKSGGNGARNYGLLQAQGTYIQWFDSDDIMHPEKLKVQIDLLQANVNTNVCICSGQKIALDGDSKRSLRRNFEDDFFRQIANNTSEIMTPSFIIKSSFLRTHSLRFDEDIFRGQETDFLLRLSQVLKKQEIIFTEQELFSYIFTIDSKSKVDEAYVSRFKWSRAKVYLDILSLSKTHSYKDIFQNRMKRLLRIYVDALKHKDEHTATYILERLNMPSDLTSPKFHKLLSRVKTFSRVVPIPRSRLRKYLQRKAKDMPLDFS